MTAVVLDRPVVAPIAVPTPKATDELIVVVCQDDINNGERCATQWCAIALAAKRLRSGGWWSMSTSGELSYLPASRVAPCEYWYSDEAGDFAADFDADPASVHPERFVFHRKSAAGRAGQ